MTDLKIQEFILGINGCRKDSNKCSLYQAQLLVRLIYSLEKGGGAKSHYRHKKRCFLRPSFLAEILSRNSSQWGSQGQQQRVDILFAKEKVFSKVVFSCQKFVENTAFCLK